MRILVLAKEPVAGRSKTRLQTRWTAEQAAALAAAALADTLHTAKQAADQVGATCELVLDGAPGPWMPSGVAVSQQVSGSHAARICAALAGREEPCLLIGMDTPQVTVEQLISGLEPLVPGGCSFGHADDGGWWALGLAEPAAHADLVLGVPTSTSETGRLQEQALRRAGLQPVRLEDLRDVDLPEDALAVALASPATRLARLVMALEEDAA